jgi:hypothetical protein
MAHAWYLERVLPNLYVLKNVNLDCLSTFCQLEVIPRSEGATDQPIGDRIDESQTSSILGINGNFQARERSEKGCTICRASGSGAWLAGDK